MPQIEHKNILRPKPGDVIIISVPEADQRSLTEELDVPQVQARIAAHFMSNAEWFQYARSGAPDDVDALRSELAPGFASLVPEVQRLNLTKREIEQPVRDAVLLSRVDPNQVDMVARLFSQSYAHQLRSFMESLPLPRAA